MELSAPSNDRLIIILIGITNHPIKNRFSNVFFQLQISVISWISIEKNQSTVED
jgi:hypothetical protein